MGSPRDTVCFCLGLGLSVACRPALADDSTEGEASRLFEEAKESMEAKRYAEACPKLARSQELDPQIGTMLNLAYCYEGLGRTASGWSEWLDAAAAAEARGQADRATMARHRAARLESRLIRLTITIAPQRARDRVEVELDGTPVDRERWGAPIPVDPGSHYVQATGAGRLTWSAKLEVDERHVPLVIVPELVEVGGGSRRTLAFVLGGAGIASLALAGVMAAAAKASYDRADCVGQACTATGMDDRAAARSEAAVASVATATGLAALVGGAVLVLAPSWPSRDFRIQATPSRDAFGVSLRGAW